MTEDEVRAICRGVAPILKKMIGQYAPIETMQALTERIHALETREPIRGERGEKGDPGPIGPQGDTGMHGRDGLDGKDGRDGQPGRDGSPGERGEKGIDGKDGRDAHVTLDELEVIQLDERSMVFRNASTGKQLGGEIRIAGFVDCGVYRETETYERGDVVSFGHIFIAQRTVSPGEKPIDGNPYEGQPWRLVVKRGRDGKQGPQGDRGPKGDKGDKGDPGRNFT